MNIREAINEFNAQSAHLKTLFSAVEKLEAHFKDSDTLASLNVELEQARSDLASERDMLASTSQDLTEALEKLKQVERETKNIVNDAQAQVTEMLNEAKAKADNLIRDAAVESTRRQRRAEQDYDALTVRVSEAKAKLEEIENAIADRSLVVEEQRSMIEAQEQRIAQLTDALLKV